MYTRKLIASSVAAALWLPGVALADIEVYGFVKNETSIYTKDGQVTGEEESTLDDDSDKHAGTLRKFENSLRLFLNGDIGEDSAWHTELNIIHDTKGVNSKYRSFRIYSEHDWLRELYLDTTLGPVELRLGKQQVVWGTADGIKLLDIVNPTDFREFVQNTFEDSRIPLWMAKAEVDAGANGNLQFIVSQRKENFIPGLNPDGDSGQPFIFKGVDSITGKVNGFLNVAPALSRVANSFTLAAFGTGLPGGPGFFDVGTGGVPGTPLDGLGDAIPSGLTSFGNLTVAGFADVTQQLNDPDGSLAGGLFSGDESIRADGSPGAAAFPGGLLLDSIADGASNFGLPAVNNNSNLTNLSDVAYNPSQPTSAFEFMPNATFATFNSFSGAFPGAGASGIRTRWDQDFPDKLEPNAGLRYKANLENGLNFSLNYFYHYDANPVVDLQWRDSVTDEHLQTIRATQNPATLAPDPTTNIGADAVPSNITVDAFGRATNSVTILLRNAAGGFYGPIDPATGGFNANTNAPELVIRERLNRIHSVGGSFDYSLDLGALPVVLRGEFLYDKDVKVPIVDKRLLSIGDLENSIRPEDADFFRYVIGVDVTVLTNLLISGQFIQFRNLDFERDGRTCTTQTGKSFDCSRYTADPTVMHFSNGFRQAEENKEFYSLFFSKPFGPSQLGRWNNITIYEENGGWWNRFDVEYSFSDEIVGTAEWNQYWGDDDSMFGQFQNSSNVQVGLKYIFE